MRIKNVCLKNLYITYIIDEQNYREMNKFDMVHMYAVSSVMIGVKMYRIGSFIE